MKKFIKIFLVFIAVIVVILYVVRLLNAAILEFLFPGVTTNVSSRSMTPIEMYVVALRGRVNLSIPEAYLTFGPNLRGGEQHTINIAAAIFWQSEDMPPRTLAQNARDARAKPDTSVLIYLHGGSKVATDDLWNLIKPSLEPVGTKGDLQEFKHKKVLQIGRAHV